MTNDGIMSGLRDSEVTAAHVRADSTHESCRPRRAKLQRPQPPRAEIPAMSDRMTAAARAFRHGVVSSSHRARLGLPGLTVCSAVALMHRSRDAPEGSARRYDVGHRHAAGIRRCWRRGDGRL